MNNEPEPKVINQELISPQIETLLSSYSQIGRCACAFLDPEKRIPAFVAGWRKEWEQFTSILPHSPERFFAALAKLNWSDVAKKPFLKFESNGHVTHCLAPVIGRQGLRGFLYVGYVLLAKPSTKEITAISEERRFHFDTFIATMKEIPVISEQAFVSSVTNLAALLKEAFDAPALPESGTPEPAAAGPEPVNTAANAEAPLELALHADVVRSLTRDIRTSLNGNIGVTGLLMRYRNEEIADLLDTMHKGNDTLLTLLDNLHDYHDILTGGLSIQRAPLDLRSVVERTAEQVAKRLKEFGLEMTIRLSPDIPSFIVTDAQRLKQVLRNVVTTVARYSVGGKLFLAIKKGQTKAGNIELHMLVQNVPENASQQGADYDEDAPLPVYDSADIGMLVSMELVRMLGGKMKIHTGDNAHIVFSILAEALQFDKSKFDTTPSDALKRQNIVVIHSNPSDMQMLSLQCTYWGMKPQTLPGAVQAVSWLSKGEPVDVFLFCDSQVKPAAFKEKLNSIPLYASCPVVEYAAAEPGEKTSIPVASRQTLRQTLEQCLKKTKVHSEQAVNQHESLAEQFPTKIMVVEDDVMNRQLIDKILKKIGFTPVLMKNGIEAVKEYSQNHYDLIFMDLQMPGMDGITAARSILSDATHGKHPNICALTANASQSDKESVFKAGMVDFLSKPILLPKLQEAIIKWGVRRETPPQEESLDEPVNEELVDEAVIMQTKELDQFSDESILDRLIFAFIKEAPPIINEIESAFTANQNFKIGKATSALAGMSRNLGLREFSTIAKRIEHRNTQADMKEMVELLTSLRSSYQNTAAQLKKYMSAGR